MYASILKQQISSLVFPVFCHGCQEQIIHGRANTPNEQSVFDNHWCFDCYQKIQGELDDRCEKCGAGAGLNNPYSGRCRLCFNLNIQFDRAIAIGNYRGLLRDTIIRMKRDQDEVLAFRLGRLLAKQLNQFQLPVEIDMIVPIPSHWSRRIKRGFSAASLIADGVSSVTGIRIQERGLVCQRPTQKQGTLSTAGRFKNVRGAFGIDRRLKVESLNLLIIDDVMTSGATADQAASTLRRNGAARTFVGIAARGARVK